MPTNLETICKCGWSAGVLPDEAACRTMYDEHVAYAEEERRLTGIALEAVERNVRNEEELNA
jgi:hypothetical protein